MIEAKVVMDPKFNVKNIIAERNENHISSSGDYKLTIDIDKNNHSRAIITTVNNEIIDVLYRDKPYFPFAFIEIYDSEWLIYAKNDSDYAILSLERDREYVTIIKNFIWMDIKVSPDNSLIMVSGFRPDEPEEIKFYKLSSNITFVEIPIQLDISVPKNYLQCDICEYKFIENNMIHYVAEEAFSEKYNKFVVELTPDQYYEFYKLIDYKDDNYKVVCDIILEYKDGVIMLNKNNMI